MNHEIQSRRILKYWTIRKLSADTCSATWCWSAWSVSKRRRETRNADTVSHLSSWNGPADLGTGEIRTRLSDLVVEQLWIKAASPLVDGVLPSFKQHQLSDPRISSKYVILVNQLPDRASSARISTIPSLSWICI